MTFRGPRFGAINAFVRSMPAPRVTRVFLAAVRCNVWSRRALVFTFFSPRLCCVGATACALSMSARKHPQLPSSVVGGLASLAAFLWAPHSRQLCARKKKRGQLPLRRLIRFFFYLLESRVRCFVANRSFCRRVFCSFIPGVRR